MGINSQDVAYNFGQMGSAFLKTAATAYTAPTGKVIVAIQAVHKTLGPQFTKLTADNDANAYFIRSNTSNGGLDTSTATDGANGANIAATFQFAPGTTLFGRWTDVTLANNCAIVMYLADKQKKY